MTTPSFPAVGPDNKIQERHLPERLSDTALTQKIQQAAGEGVAPHIGPNGNWWVGETDTGTPAQGPPGTGGGGGGGGLVPDPDNDGLYVIQSGSSLTPDPDHPGLYLIGA